MFLSEFRPCRASGNLWEPPIGIPMAHSMGQDNLLSIQLLLDHQNGKGRVRIMRSANSPMDLRKREESQMAIKYSSRKQILK